MTGVRPEVILCLGGVLLASCSSSRPPAAPSTLRVFTMNIHHAKGTDGKQDIERISALIRSQVPDVVALQEVDRDVGAFGESDMMTILADETGFAYAFDEVEVHGGVSTGNAILCRYPFVEEKHFALTASRSARPPGVLAVVFDALGADIVCVSTQIDSQLAPHEQALAAAELRRDLRQFLPHPIIVCGDFQADARSEVVDSMMVDMNDAWIDRGAGAGFTFPLPTPTRRPDHIFYATGAGLAQLLSPLSARTVETTSSDHAPVVVDFSISH